METGIKDTTDQVEDVDVDYTGEPEVVTDSPKEAEEKDVVDILEPKAGAKEWTIGKGDYERKYVQKPFSFISRMEWFALVGDVMDKAMTGDGALSVSSILEPPGQRGQTLSVNDFRNADTFVHAVGKLLVHAPDFLTRSYCIWLGVPKYERELASELMSLPEEEGGLSDDQGFEIIEIFIDQNAEALNRFFREKLPALQKRLSQRLQSEDDQQSRR